MGPAHGGTRLTRRPHRGRAGTRAGRGPDLIGPERAVAAVFLTGCSIGFARRSSSNIKSAENWTVNRIVEGPMPAGMVRTAWGSLAGSLSGRTRGRCRIERIGSRRHG